MKRNFLAVAVAGALALPAAALAALAAPPNRPPFLKNKAGPVEPDGSPVFPGYCKSRTAEIADGKGYFNQMMTKFGAAREKAKAAWIGVGAVVEARLQAMKATARKMDARRRTAAFGHQLVPTGGA